MLSSLEDSIEQRIKALQIKENVLNSLFLELLLWDIHFSGTSPQTIDRLFSFFCLLIDTKVRTYGFPILKWCAQVCLDMS